MRPGKLNVVGALANASASFPHLRIRQLIDNAMTHFKTHMPEVYSGDLFYIPDDILVVALEKYTEDFGRT